MLMMCIPLLACISCHDKSQDKTEQPAGVGMQKSASGNTVIVLKDKQTLVVRQEGKNGQSVSIANTKQGLEVEQLGKDGDVPVGLLVKNDDSTKIKVTRKTGKSSTLYVDENGKGTPDYKCDESGKYVVGYIKWIKVDQDAVKHQQSGEPVRQEQNHAVPDHHP